MTQHREGRSIAVSKKRIEEHELRSKTCPPQNFDNKLVKKNYIENDISIRISSIDFLTALCSKLTNNLSDTFLHFNLNSTIFDNKISTYKTHQGEIRFHQ